MPSMQTVPVCPVLDVGSRDACSHPTLANIVEIAVSLNSNEVRIYARQGNDWNHIDTLSEVRCTLFLIKIALASLLTLHGTARQTDYFHRLGP